MGKFGAVKDLVEHPLRANFGERPETWSAAEREGCADQRGPGGDVPSQSLFLGSFRAFQRKQPGSDVATGTLFLPHFRGHACGRTVLVAGHLAQ